MSRISFIYPHLRITNSSMPGLAALKWAITNLKMPINRLNSMKREFIQKEQKYKLLKFDLHCTSLNVQSMTLLSLGGKEKPEKMLSYQVPWNHLALFVFLLDQLR